MRSRHLVSLPRAAGALQARAAGWSEPPAQHPRQRNPAPVILSKAEALNRPHLDQLSVGTLVTPAITALRCLLLEQLLPRQPDPTLARQPRCLQPGLQGKYAHLPPVACSCDPASPSSCPGLCPWLSRPEPWVHGYMSSLHCISWPLAAQALQVCWAQVVL